MKPRIRYGRALAAWVVQEPAKAAGVPPTTVRETWPQALAVVGIRVADRWWV
jgi:hypothetical protein